ncbi:MAG: hypothetical protein F2813_04810 [Actinobacteria bacterium]|uniref:Unannotated protein n=1 Tax=freshwater metagenome TaxID=449393 RepID=A0A6J5ZZ57_9ZZZZ|nr:hypothetical protein [Actinomycetota bacterium]
MSDNTGRDLHAGSTKLLSAVMILVGAGLVIRTLVLGGGPFAIGVIMGVLFVAAGCGRLWVARKGI